MNVTDVDAVTLAYIELISAKQGQAAVDAYMASSGWRQDRKGRFQLPQGQRLAMAKATAHVGANQARHAVMDGRTPPCAVLR